MQNNKPSALSRLFNFLTEPPKHSLTVGGLLFGEADHADVSFNMMKAWAMPRGGRAVERVVTLSGIFLACAYAAAAVASAPVFVIPVALAFAGVSKAAGMVAGGGTNALIKAARRRLERPQV